MAQKQLSRGRRFRTGCLTCRQRRKKCDETYPVCGHCLRLNLVCNRKEPVSFAPEKSSDESSEALLAQVYQNRQVSISTAIIPASAIDSAPGGDNRYMLKYYIEVLSMLCTTSVDSNSFVNVFVPMAMQSTSVLNSILAWSASHMSAFQTSYEPYAIRFGSSAFQCLASDLSDTSKHDTSLASCLILCAAASPSNQWYSHLEGAKTIIEATVAPGPGGKVLRGLEYFKQSQDGQWLLRDFSYHDIVGAVAMGCEPLIKGKYWMANGQRVLDACMGLGSEVLGLLSEICCLKRENWENSTTALAAYGTEFEEYDTENYSTWAPFVDIDSRLRAWKCTEGGPEYLAELAECHRLTTLLCLYRKMRELFPHDIASINSEISVIVSLLSQSIENIPYQAMAEAGLIFPVFMAGGDAEGEASIAMLRTRMQALQGHRGFKYISLALEVLEELWRLKLRKVRRPDGTGIDWRDIVRRRNIKLMLF